MRIAAPLLCLSPLGLLLVGCGRRPSATPPPAPAAAPTASPLPVAAELREARSVFSDGKGNRVLEVSGGQFAVPPGTTQAVLLGTHAVLYRDGKPSLKIDAREVRVEWSARRLTAQGSVTAQTSDGRTVRCETLTWLPGQDMTKSWGTVTGVGNVAFLSGSELALYGSRFTADTLLQTLKLLP